MKILGVVLLILVVLPVLGLGLLSLVSRKPSNLGVADGRLRACPATPNCVCTFDKDAEHGVEPLRFEGAAAEGMRRVKSALATLPRTVVVEETPNYLRAESTSLLFRFVDDVEVLVDESAHRIHLRSASRIGRSDLGVNRRRVEAIRSAFAASK